MDKTRGNINNYFLKLVDKQEINVLDYKGNVGYISMRQTTDNYK